MIKKWESHRKSCVRMKNWRTKDQSLTNQKFIPYPEPMLQADEVLQ